METFVICHGAFGGGWSWRAAAESLAAMGHRVYTPTFTGLGERSHLAHPDIDLALHIKDVENVVAFERIDSLVLVGHSYGGAVATGAAARLGSRVKHLVYIDALVPRDGECVADLYDQETVEYLTEATNVWGDGWRVPPPDAETDSRWVTQPMKTLTQPLDLGGVSLDGLPKTFICCTRRSEANALLHAPIQRVVERARAEGWSYLEIEADHSPQLDHPHQVAELLVHAVTGAGAPS